MIAASAPELSLNVQNAAPRPKAPDSATVWQAMTEARDRNQADLLGANFAGTALDKLTATVGEQRKIPGRYSRGKPCQLFDIS